MMKAHVMRFIGADWPPLQSVVVRGVESASS